METASGEKLYRYSDEDLNKEYEDPWKSPKGAADFLTLIYFWFYHEDEDFESVGVWGFENKLHAIKYLYRNLMESEEYINRELFGEMKDQFENAINSIIERRIDSDVDLNFASYDNGTNGLIIICQGYWDNVVKDIASYIKEVLEHEYAHINGENSYHEHGELLGEEGEEYLKELKRELDDCKMVLTAEDLKGEDFVESFIRMCDSFDARMNG